jgi:hypothetical protein
MTSRAFVFHVKLRFHVKHHIGCCPPIVDDGFGHDRLWSSGGRRPGARLFHVKRHVSRETGGVPAGRQRGISDNQRGTFHVKHRMGLTLYDQR